MNENPKRIKRGWMNLRVDRIIDETSDTKTFFLIDHEEGGLGFDYIAGQYLTFRFDEIFDKPIVRSYTMSSSPCQRGYAAFTVKRVDGGLISNWLCDHIKVGSILRARGPIGKFCFFPESDQPHLAMLAAGSGVTPFVSIMREFAHLPAVVKTQPISMSLLVSYRSENDIILAQDLEEIASVSGFKVQITLTRQNMEKYWFGRPDRAMINRWLDSIGGWSNTTYMTCGPEAMMKQFKEYLLEKNIPEALIKTESFA